MNFEYETQRLILRVIKPSPVYTGQVLRFFSYNRDYFEPYEPVRPHNFYTSAYQQSLLTCEYNLAVRMQTIRFWVWEKNTPDQIAGTVCFHNITRSAYDRCEAGYKFDRHFWHKGYAREALGFGIQLMFDELELHRIEAYVMKQNIPSIRLLDALGFSCEGTCRQFAKINGSWEDHDRYALLR